MLVINKTTDLRILGAMGLPPIQMAGIIGSTGMLIVIFGLISGLTLGSLVCIIQMQYGIVPLGMATTFIKSYPIDLQWNDYVIISVWVLFSGFLALIRPAQTATAVGVGFQRV